MFFASDKKAKLERSLFLILELYLRLFVSNVETIEKLKIDKKRSIEPVLGPGYGYLLKCMQKNQNFLWA